MGVGHPSGAGDGPRPGGSLARGWGSGPDLVGEQGLDSPGTAGQGDGDGMT